MTGQLARQDTFEIWRDTKKKKIMKRSLSQSYFALESLV